MITLVIMGQLAISKLVIQKIGLISIFYWIKHCKGHVICNTSRGIKELGFRPSKKNHLHDIIIRT